MSVRLQKRQQESGFTLVELMIVVVIIGILAAIAIPQFNKFQLRSKHSEAPGILTAIAKANDSFAAKWGAFALFSDEPACIDGSCPPAVAPTGGKELWTTCEQGAAGTKFGTGNCLIGYRPTGRTYFRYGIAAGDSFGSAAFVGGSGDATLGVSGGYPCMVCAGALQANSVAAQISDVDYTTSANADIDGDTNECVYTATDENYDSLPNPSTCGEEVF